MKFELTFTPPKVGSGKSKNQYCTNNNIPVWYRFLKTKIKNEFKESIKQWYVPVAENTFRRATVTFQIKRDSGRKIDSDAFGVSAYKWFIDSLTEQGWLKDDDCVRIILEPAILNCDANETQIHVKVELYEEII
jgi:hypothetical protein